MQYKIYYEPMYANECRAVLFHIVNNSSIRKDMEMVIEERGESTRSSVECLFQKSLAMEKYVKENLCLSLVGYEEKGKEMAEFLLGKWENAEQTPLDAICAYDLLLRSGVDNRAVMIMYAIGLAFMEQVYSLKDIETAIIPPNLSDAEFFALINQSHLNQEERLKALDLYYNFTSYREYAHALLKHTEDLLNDKIKEYKDDIQSHMNFVENQLITQNGVLLDEPRVDISAEDGLEYHIYPSVYQANSLTMSTSSLFPPYVIIGMSIYSMKELSDGTELEKEMAIQFLKCLGDSTKQDILQLLKKESLYGSQLAEILNCTGANISQHMHSLAKLNVVSLRKENNRVYFYLNKEAIHNHLDVVKELFG